VGRSPWTAADALVGLWGLSKFLIHRAKKRVQGDPRRPGGLPHELCSTESNGDSPIYPEGDEMAALSARSLLHYQLTLHSLVPQAAEMRAFKRECAGFIGGEFDGNSLALFQ